MTTLDPARLAVRLTDARQTFDGAWWPLSRTFSAEFVRLHDQWPPDAGYISRAFVARSDWDDPPTTVAIPGRRGAVRVGLLPSGTRNQVVLIMLDGQRRTIVVLPPTSSYLAAARIMRAFVSPAVPA